MTVSFCNSNAVVELSHFFNITQLLPDIALSHFCEQQMNRRSHTFLTLNPYFSVVGFNYEFADIQAKTSSTVPSRCRSIDLIEPLEQLGDEVLWNADTCVTHRDMQIIIFLISNCKHQKARSRRVPIGARPALCS